MRCKENWMIFSLDYSFYSIKISLYLSFIEYEKKKELQGNQGGRIIIVIIIIKSNMRIIGFVLFCSPDSWVCVCVCLLCCSYP